MPMLPCTCNFPAAKILFFSSQALGFREDAGERLQSRRASDERDSQCLANMVL